jgi:hypothetical protein
MRSSAGDARPRIALAVGLLIAVSGCVSSVRQSGTSRWNSALPPLTLDGTSGTTDTIDTGALHHSFVVRQGPWAVHVLDIDRAACWVPAATKGAVGAAGRAKTSELARGTHGEALVAAGGVNADFFLFDPPGVPTGAHVSDHALVTGPGARPVFAIDSAGDPWIGVLSDTGVVIAGADSIPISSWNRLSPTGVAWFDARYGSTIDTASGTMRIVISARRGGVRQSIDSMLVGTSIPASGGVLVIGARAPVQLRERVLRVAGDGRQVDVDVHLMPIRPREAVGGFPVLVRDSREVPGLDSAGAITFAPVRHPRTLIGVAAGGRRLMLITIDGRQPGYSVGTTNRESARIALALGATDALNLDGGGSTTMVVARTRGDSTTFEVVNRPSDAQGERAVGNALVVVRKRGRGC